MIIKNDAIDGRQQYYTDAADNIVEIRTYYDPSNAAAYYSEKYTYDASGLLVESELFKHNKLITKNSYKNNNDGSNTELNYSGDSSVYTYLYNYDSKGNWIKKIVFEQVHNFLNPKNNEPRP